MNDPGPYDPGMHDPRPDLSPLKEPGERNPPPPTFFVISPLVDFFFRTETSRFKTIFVKNRPIELHRSCLS